MKYTGQTIAKLLLAAILAVAFVLVGWWLLHRSDTKGTDEASSLPAPTTSATTTTTTAAPTTMTTTTTAAPTTTTTAAPTTQKAPEGGIDFSGVLFVGDSRTVGLKEYGGLNNADFFATVGMSVYKVHSEKVALPGRDAQSFEEVIRNKQYKRVYVMLGVNEIGYNRSTTLKRFSELLEEIRQNQPNATIVICANLRVGAARSARDKSVNNPNIDQYNQAIAAYADGSRIKYLDVNPLFDDGQGNLGSQYTSDGTHVLAKYYRTWAQWLAAQPV